MYTRLCRCLQVSSPTIFELINFMSLNISVFLACSILLVFAGTKGQAQSKSISPGYIVTLQKDTIPGLILRKSDFENTRKISFQEKGVGAFKDYTPTEITAYSADNQLYLAEDVTDPSIARKLFLQEIVNGQVSLYRAEDEAGELQLFLKDKSGWVTYLKKSIYYGLLKTMLTDCDQIKLDDSPNNLNRYAYNTVKLQKLLMDYNKCVHPEWKVKEIRRGKPVFSFGLKGGASYSSYGIYFQGNPLFAGKGYYKTGYSMGGSFGITMKNTYSAYLEAFYSVTGGYRESGNVDKFHNITDFTLHTLWIPLLFKYSFTNQKLQPYLLGGVNMGILLSKQNYSFSNYYGTHFTYGSHPQWVADLSVEKFSIGFTGGLGAGYKISPKGSILSEIRFTNNSFRRGVNPIITGNTVELLMGFEL